MATSARYSVSMGPPFKSSSCRDSAMSAPAYFFEQSLVVREVELGELGVLLRARGSSCLLLVPPFSHPMGEHAKRWRFSTDNWASVARRLGPVACPETHF